jgi:acyl-coenzyme A synthetase/AMP-(fatty) acid ligase
MERERLTVWYSVPFALIQMLTHGSLSQRDLQTLRWVLFGGEPFPVGYLSELMRLLPSCRFSNVYGPAEVNQCSFYHVDRATLQNAEHVPLGAVWPIAQWQILGANDEPVPDGEVGELLIAAPTLMRGYWNRPELTDRAITKVAGRSERYYRTGDLVHVDAAGVMHFNGRKDRQIKLRGYRIELDEVENAIYDEPAVEEAATFKIAQESGEPRILAAVTLRRPLEQAEKKIRRAVKRRVPPYAVPSEVFVVDTLPRTGSNKIDRNKLAKIYSERAE